MSWLLLTLQLRYEHDVVLARQRIRQVASLVGFDPHEQTRLATAVSELARNAYQYAGGGRIEIAVECATGSDPRLVVRVKDDGPGIHDLQAILDGRYVSSTGMGIGILGARRLTGHFHIESVPGSGTFVEFAQDFPRGRLPFSSQELARVTAVLARQETETPFEEIQRQNQELLHLLEEVRARQAEVERLNSELEATNRGVLALYAELDDRAQDLKRISEGKSRFLSDVGHELRTPLTSVLNLTHILLNRMDGPLTDEQEKQITLIRRSAQTVTELVNDLLDLAKIEAGKTTLHLSQFTVAELFGALRGLFRSLVTNERVTLVFEDAPGVLPLSTDEGRLSQILRNFVSNALKFTSVGEIYVTASAGPDDTVQFEVRDTGIGIAPEDQERIFEEFIQIEHSAQRHLQGTGLGLPLARKLAVLLGGCITLQSQIGVGSTFAVVIPRVHVSPRATARHKLPQTLFQSEEEMYAP